MNGESFKNKYSYSIAGLQGIINGCTFVEKFILEKEMKGEKWRRGEGLRLNVCFIASNGQMLQADL